MPFFGEQPRPFPRFLFIILVCSFLLNFIGIGWGLPSWHGWAIDEIIPAKVLGGVEQFFSHGWHSEYPPLHYYVISIFYLPFLLLQRLHMIDIKADFTFYTILFFIGRLISVLMGTAIVFLVYRCGCELFERRAALFAAMITALMGPFVYYAKMMNVDIPYIFWFVFSLVFFVRILKKHQPADYMLFALTAVCSICTKDQAYGLYMLTPLPIVISGYFHQNKLAPGSKFLYAVFNRKTTLAFGAAVALFVVLQNMMFNFSGFVSHVRLIAGPSSKGYQMFPRTLAGHGQMLWQALKHLQFLFGWPLFLVCLAGLLISVLRRKGNGLLFCILVPGISYYLFFVNVVMYHYDRFLIPIAILLAFFGGKLMADWLNPKQRWYFGKKVFLGVIVSYSVWYAASIDINMLTDSRYKIEAWMAKHIGEDKTIGFIGILQCLPRPLRFKNSKSLFHPTAEKIQLVMPDYLVFNPAITFGEADFYERLRLKELGYFKILQYRTPRKWTLFDHGTILVNGKERIFSNLDKVNPEIAIFKLAATPGKTQRFGSQRP